jgi:hypothetical protein
MLTGLLDRLMSSWITPQQVRAEAMSLGYRHNGRILEGAKAELAHPNLPMRRAILLQAVIRNRRGSS